MSLEKGENAFIHHTVRCYGRNVIGDNSIVLENVFLGYPTSDILVKMRASHHPAEDFDFEGCILGHDNLIRTENIIYKDVKLGDYVRTGHKVLIRENTIIGTNVLIGTNVVIDNNVRIGNDVSIQSTVYIPTNTIIEDKVFLGPNCVFTNDRYPIRIKSDLKAPIIRRGASIGGNVTILPGIEIGEGAIVAAGSIVTKNVPPWRLAKGVPAVVSELPKELKVTNNIVLKDKKYYENKT